MTSDAAAREAFIELNTEIFGPRVSEICKTNPMALTFFLKIGGLTQEAKASGMGIDDWIEILDVQTEILRLASVEKRETKP